MKYFVGIDLHRDYFTSHATDEEGNDLLRERFSNSLISVEKLRDHFPVAPQVVVEATRNWMWLVKALKNKGCQVTLAHPLKTKAIASARIKTDSLDAKTLCHLLRSNLVPSAYVANEDEQDNREIGDIDRFNTAKKFTSYFGLVPRLNQSGNHAYYGRITKLGNPYVRWSLIQAAHRLARMDKDFKRFVLRIAYRGGKKKAIVALARKLATIVFCLLKEEREYIPDFRRPKG